MASDNNSISGFMNYAFPDGDKILKCLHTPKKKKNGKSKKLKEYKWSMMELGKPEPKPKRKKNGYKA